MRDAGQRGRSSLEVGATSTMCLDCRGEGVCQPGTTRQRHVLAPEVIVGNVRVELAQGRPHPLCVCCV